MAFSQSIEKAQNPALCQFCEESNIKWRCINCDLFLCQLCNSRIHSKIKSSDKHEILNLKECGTEDAAATIRKVDLHNIPCTIHSEQKCFVYCNSNECKHPICSECLTESHQKHEFKKLNEVYDSIVSKISALKGKIETDIKWYENGKVKYEQLLAEGDKNFQVTKDKIIQTEKKMTERISRYARELLLELETKWRPLENTIKTELSIITGNKDDLVLRKGILDTTLLSHQSSDIFSTNKTMDFKLPNKSYTEIDLKETKFIPGIYSKMFESQINAEFGNLYTIPDFKVVKNYQSDLHCVTSIQHSDNNTAFIACFNEKLKAVKFEDNNIKIQKEVEIKVNDMAIQHNGDLIISCQENDLKCYNDREVKSFKSFSPLNTASVHVDKGNQIVVGLYESDNSSSNLVSKHGKVVVMNQKGDIQHTLEYDRNNQRLFTLPFRIKTLNDKIIVVDLINEKLNGRVLALDYGGQLQWTYKGFGIVNTDETNFHPADIAVSSNEMIVVSDYCNHALLILSPTGEIILYKDIKPMGIELSFGMAFDKDGVLWMGCQMGTNKAKTSICALKLV